MALRIREACADASTGSATNGLFEGPVEETTIGGKECKKHASKKPNAGRGTAGKTLVVGGWDGADQ